MQTVREMLTHRAITEADEHGEILIRTVWANKKIYEVFQWHGDKWLDTHFTYPQSSATLTERAIHGWVRLSNGEDHE